MPHAAMPLMLLRDTAADAFYAFAAATLCHCRHAADTLILMLITLCRFFATFCLYAVYFRPYAAVAMKMACR